LVWCESKDYGELREVIGTVSTARSLVIDGVIDAAMFSRIL